MKLLDYLFITPENIDKRINNCLIDIKRFARLSLSSGKKSSKYWNKLRSAEKDLEDLKKIKETGNFSRKVL